MNKLLYKILPLCCLALLACSEDVDLGDVNISGSQGVESIIRLSAGVAPTRGEVLTNDDFTSFKLFAFCEDDETQSFMTTMTREVADNSCTFDDGVVHKWPEDGDGNSLALKFCGLYPYDGLVPQVASDDFTVDYTSDYDHTKQHDLVAASLESGEVSVVHLDFDHLLSKINFSLTVKTDEVNIRNVKLFYTYKKLSQTATYSFKDKKWFDIQEGGYRGPYQLGSSYTPITKNEKISYEPTPLFVIPQAINNLAYLAVSAEYDVYNGDNFNHTVTTSNLALVNSDVTQNLVSEWEQSKEYTYDLSINGKNEMSFTMSVDKRDDMLAQGNIDLQYIENEASTKARVETLINDDVAQVLDFVVYGAYKGYEFGHSYQNNPFITAFGDVCTITGGVVTYNYNSTDAHLAEDKLISVDLRAITNLPTFSLMHGSLPDQSVADNNLTGDEAVLPRQIFEHVRRLEEVMMPDGISAIGDLAFQGCMNLKRVYLGTTQHIETLAFQNCDNLTDVYGDKLTRIHAYAFDHCEKLVNIDLSNVHEINEYGFVNCTMLGDVDLMNIEIIDEHAFSDCVNMDIAMDANLPKLSHINDYAFKGCAKLGTNKSVNLSDAIYIDDYAFNGCASLRFSTDETKYTMLGIKDIGDYVFQQCAHIEDINISNISTIGDSAFIDCTAMTFNGADQLFDNLTSIGASAFQRCLKLCSKMPITIDPAKILQIGEAAFNKADLRLANTGELNFVKVASLGHSTFADCRNLDASFNFSNAGVTQVPYDCFNRCYSLNSLRLDNVSYVGDRALFGCRDLRFLRIGGAGLTVGVETFKDMPFTAECDLVLNADQDAKITNKNMWQGKEWKTITFTDGGSPSDDGVMHCNFSWYYEYLNSDAAIDKPYDPAVNVYNVNNDLNNVRLAKRLTQLATISTDVKVVGDFTNCTFAFTNYCCPANQK